MSKILEISDEQYAALAEVAGRRGESPDQIIAEVLAEVTRASGNMTPVTSTGFVARQTILRLRGDKPHVILDVLMPQVEPSQLIRALAHALGVAEAELSTKAAIVYHEAYETEDWFRHLGATEEEIRESAVLADQLFPPDEQETPTMAAGQNADSR